MYGTPCWPAVGPSQDCCVSLSNTKLKAPGRVSSSVVSQNVKRQHDHTYSSIPKNNETILYMCVYVCIHIYMHINRCIYIYCMCIYIHIYLSADLTAKHLGECRQRSRGRSRRGPWSIRPVLRVYRVTSLITKRNSLGPYRRFRPRVLGGS